tara:strand:+ start:274 stop:429 length:156 start_codon:yes stop_codon:yes gene_type:complete
MSNAEIQETLRQVLVPEIKFLLIDQGCEKDKIFEQLELLVEDLRLTPEEDF